MPWKLHYFGEPLSETLHLPNKKVLSFVDTGEISFESLSILFFQKICVQLLLYLFFWSYSVMDFILFSIKVNPFWSSQ